MNWDPETSTLAPWELHALIQKLKGQLQLADNLAQACQVKYYGEFALELERYIAARGK